MMTRLGEFILLGLLIFLYSIEIVLIIKLSEKFF
jgi:hypothetical protein